MPLDLKQPLRWHDHAKDPDIHSALSGLQANILKGHGREHTANLFFRFGGSDGGRNFLRALPLTSALEQLQAAERFRQGGTGGGPVICAMLSARGYESLGITPEQRPSSLPRRGEEKEAFREGMAARARMLSDPSPEDLEPSLAQEIHLLVLVADTTPALVDSTTRKLLAEARAGNLVLLHLERGKARKNRAGEGVEHFGYVDGRSQPLLLWEEIEQEWLRTGRPLPATNPEATLGVLENWQWSPVFNLDQVLRPCPGGQGFGSYFVFRKLEQDVRGFKAREKAVAEELGLQGEDEERAGALMVGRFEDGTPVVRSPEAQGEKPGNNFNYDDDPAGLRCPMAAHVRKVNTRTPETRPATMARRGITYGEREKEPNDTQTPDEMPDKDVGLLFMAYMADIEGQFEKNQIGFANDPDFPAPATGLDPVIGQPKSPVPNLISCPVAWGLPGTKAVDFRSFVRLRGGEYFFAPCLGFFKTLAPSPPKPPPSSSAAAVTPVALKPS